MTPTYRGRAQASLNAYGSASGRRWAEHEHRVEAAEREGVRHGVGDRLIAPDIGDVVEIAPRVGLRQARGRRNEPFLDGLDAGDRLDAAAGAEQMSVHRFGGG